MEYGGIGFICWTTREWWKRLGSGDIANMNKKQISAENILEYDITGDGNSIKAALFVHQNSPPQFKHIRREAEPEQRYQHLECHSQSTTFRTASHMLLYLCSYIEDSSFS